MPGTGTLGQKLANSGRKPTQTSVAVARILPTANAKEGGDLIAQAATADARDVIRDEIELAVKLREEKEGLFKRIGRNRQVLRNLGTLTPDERKWVDAFYPRKQKGAENGAG